MNTLLRLGVRVCAYVCVYVCVCECRWQDVGYAMGANYTWYHAQVAGYGNPCLKQRWDHTTLFMKKTSLLMSCMLSVPEPYIAMIRSEYSIMILSTYRMDLVMWRGHWCSATYGVDEKIEYLEIKILKKAKTKDVDMAKGLTAMFMDGQRWIGEKTLVGFLLRNSRLLGSLAVAIVGWRREAGNSSCINGILGPTIHCLLLSKDNRHLHGWIYYPFT